MQNYKEKAEEFKGLEKGWDSYGGAPIAPEAADAAAAAAEMFANKSPFMVPAPDGTATLDWHYGGFECEIDFDQEGRPSCFFYRTPDGSVEVCLDTESN